MGAGKEQRMFSKDKETYEIIRRYSGKKSAEECIAAVIRLHAQDESRINYNERKGADG